MDDDGNDDDDDDDDDANDNVRRVHMKDHDTSVHKHSKGASGEDGKTQNQARNIDVDGHRQSLRGGTDSVNKVPPGASVTDNMVSQSQSLQGGTDSVDKGPPGVSITDNMVSHRETLRGGTDSVNKVPPGAPVTEKMVSQSHTPQADTNTVYNQHIQSNTKIQNNNSDEDAPWSLIEEVVKKTAAIFPAMICVHLSCNVQTKTLKLAGVTHFPPPPPREPTRYHTYVNTYVHVWCMYACTEIGGSYALPASATGRAYQVQYIRTCIHTCVHVWSVYTYIEIGGSCIHTLKLAGVVYIEIGGSVFVHTIHTYRCACLHVFIHACIHAGVGTMMRWQS